MSRPLFRRRSLALVLIGASAVHSSCGTILHPERIGQPPGRLDPGIVALNGVGLLIFLIPGAIAFAVDFYTGAIYLPPHYADNASAPTTGDTLIAIHVDPQSLTREHIEQVVHQHTGQRISLAPGAYSVARCDSIDEFDVTTRQLAQHQPGHRASSVIFRCQSE